MTFPVEISKKAQKELKSLDKISAKRCIEKIALLESNPFSREAIKVKGEQNVYRIRFGKYRILYEVYHERKLALIVEIDKRERVYD